MSLGVIDNAATTLVRAMAELVKKPSLMNKAQFEVRNCIGKKGKVTESDIEHLHFLKMIIKETFWLHPPAPLLLPRESISHFTVNGYEIYPKTLIQFMDSSICTKGQHFGLLPFGSGRRICPALYMGTTMVELGLANLLYCFDWELPSGMKEEDINLEESAASSLTSLKLVPKKHFSFHKTSAIVEIMNGRITNFAALCSMSCNKQVHQNIPTRSVSS
ncbi:hypothetical protein TIFTF001_018231 [Ficus carica]|uniref:Cytochrome P450 n=1 Tax=Ficus carica TaxID=3494 RepID=A0AA88D924_FICCA|nr:hypothetical protein TIFTF001_018231 [Ficus carica]